MKHNFPGYFKFVRFFNNARAACKAVAIYGTGIIHETYGPHLQSSNEISSNEKLKEIKCFVKCK